jgi:hypothetical protein
VIKPGDGEQHTQKDALSLPDGYLVNATYPRAREGLKSLSLQLYIEKQRGGMRLLQYCISFPPLDGTRLVYLPSNKLVMLRK